MAELRRLPELALSGRSVAVADLHLDPFEREAGEHFAAWTRGLAADRLLVLGDLFDAWVGPAHESAPGARCVIEAFLELEARGCEVLVLQGNRDFLLGSSFEGASRARVYPEGLVGELAGRRILFLHGDELCTRDRAYQRLRRVTHSGVVQRLGPRVPLFLSRRIAARLRRVSQRAVAAKLPAEKAIQEGAAVEHLRRNRCDLLVCGHVHEARDVPLDGDGRWLILDAFGGARDALFLEGQQAELASSGECGAGKGAAH